MIRTAACTAVIAIGGCSTPAPRPLAGLDAKSVCVLAPALPLASGKPFAEGLSVTLVAAFNRDGTTDSIRIAKSSGDPEFDRYSFERLARSDCRSLAQTDEFQKLDSEARLLIPYVFNSSTRAQDK